MDKMDRLDRMLLQLPSDAPADNLAFQVFRHVQARRRRKIYIRFGLSLVLAANGLWLIFPLVLEFPTSASLSNSGLRLFLELIQTAGNNLEMFVNATWNSISGLQTGVAAPITASVWLGLAILAMSALLALGPLLPENNVLSNEGA